MGNKQEDLKKIPMQDLIRMMGKKKQQEQIPKTDRSSNIFPLSYEQNGQWFMQQFAADCVYHVSQSYLIRGQLDITPLEAILNRLVQRHEIMRTIFTSVDGMPSQVVREHMPVKLLIKDLREIPPNEQMKQVDEMNRELCQIPFNISVGPLWRFMVIRLSGEAVVLSYTLHHIISDGWSLGVLIQEILGMYNEGTDKIKALPPLPVQYADYTQWQMNQIGQTRMQKQLDFWKERLEGADKCINLPYCVSRNQVMSHNGQNYYFEIGQTQWEEIKQFCHQHNVTSYHVLLSVLFILLHLYSQDTEICIGSPVANRNKVELEGLIGLFMNTVAVKAAVNENDPFAGFLQDVKKIAVESFENAEVPFEKVIEALNLERQPIYNPVFQVLFVQMDTSMMAATTEISHLDVTSLPVSTGTSQLDLSLYVTTDGRHAAAYFEYNTDLFTESIMKSMADDYCRLLNMAMADPAQKISAYEQQMESRKISMVISSSFVAELLSESISFWIQKLAMPCSIKYAPYSRIFEQLIDKDSMFRQKDTLPVIILRLEDWIQGRTYHSLAEYEELEEILEKNTRDFIGYVNQSGLIELTVYLCPCSERIQSDFTLNALIRRMERQIAGHCRPAKIYRTNDVTGKYGLDNYLDEKSDQEWHIPYTREFFTALGTEIVTNLFNRYADE